MNPATFEEWLIRSLAVGAIGAAFVSLCPASWRVRVRLAVPVVVFSVLLALSFGFFRALPQMEVRAPAFVAKWTALPAGWASPWMIGIFRAGVVFFFGRMIAGAFSIRRIVRRSRAVRGRSWHVLLGECQRSLGLRGNVEMRLAGPDFIPGATGLFRRTVLLPDEALHWTREQRRLVLLHELGHFRRGDLWTHALGQLACVLHWFNPFVWMLNRRLALEREFACDALVLSRGAAPDDYATLLWEMGVAAQTSRPGPVAYLAMAAPAQGKLEQRVRRILSPMHRAGLWWRVADSAFCGISALLLIVCGSFKPVVVRSFLGVSPWTAQEIQTRLAADPFPGK